MTAIGHLSEAVKLFLEEGKNEAALNVLALVIEHE